MSSRSKVSIALALWALVAALIIGAGVSMGDFNSAAPVTQTALAADGVGSPPGDLSNPALQGYVATPENPSAPLDLLPAKRWATSNSLYTKYSDLEAVANVQTVLAGAAMAFAAITWNILLTVLNWALTVDFITGATTTLNTISMQLASSLWSSGLIAILALVTLVLAARALLRGGLGKGLSLVLAFVIPLAALQVLMSGLSSGEEAPKLSPAWLAEKGSYISTEVGSGVLVSLTEFLGYNGGSSYVDGQGDSTGYCLEYTSALYATYAAANDAGADAIDAGSTLDVGTQSKSMILVSTLWEKGFLNNWITAQYGDLAQGQDMFCSQLEITREASVQERYAIVGGTAPANVALGGEEGAAVSRPPAGSPFAGWGLRPFTRISPLAVSGQQNHANAQVFAWAACDGSKANDGWKVLGDEKVTDENCAAWSTAAGFDEPLDRTGEAAARELFTPPGEDQAATPEAITVPGDPANLAKAVQAGMSEDPSQTAALEQVSQTQLAFWGQNQAQRQVQAALASLAAVLYAYSLGTIALGVVLAQILLAVLLALLPVSLLLAALPSQRAGSNPGWRMIKMTAGAMVAKVVLLFILTLLLIVTNIVAGLDSSFGGDAGLLAAFAPLAAFLALRFILKRMGLGSVLSPGGALGLTTGASLQAVGDTKAASAVNESSTKTLNSPKRAFQSGRQEWDRFQNKRYRKARTAEMNARKGAVALLKGGGAGSSDNRRREVAAAAATAAAGGVLGRSLLPSLNATNTDKNAAAEARENATRPAASAEDAADNLAKVREDQSASAKKVAAKQGLREAAVLTDAEMMQRNENYADQRDLGENAKYLSTDTLPLNPVLNDGAAGGVLGESGEIHAWGAVPDEVQAVVGEVAKSMAQADNFAKGDLENYMRAAQHAVLVDMGLTDLTGAEFDLRDMFDIPADATFNPNDVVPQLQAAAQQYLDKYAGNPERIRQAVAEGAQVFLSGVNTNRQEVEVRTTLENLEHSGQTLSVSLQAAQQALPGITQTLVNPAFVADSVRAAISAAAATRAEAVNAKLQVNLQAAVSQEERQDAGRIAQRDLEAIEAEMRSQMTQATTLAFKLDSAGVIKRPQVVKEFESLLDTVRDTSVWQRHAVEQEYRSAFGK